MKDIFINNEQLTDGKKYSYLGGDTVSGSPTISVASITDFAINQVLLIGNFGNESSEIILTHASTSPSGTTVTLASNTAQPHSRGDKVTIIDYNQIEISWSATSTGAKTVLNTISIQADGIESLYRETTETSGYYFIRFNNSITAVFSDYSGAIPFSGFAENTPARIKERALMDLGEQITDLISHKFLNTAIDEARRDLDQDPRVIRWTFRKKFGVTIGQVIPGAWSVTAPTNLRTPNTNANIMQLRVGLNGWPIAYQDNMEFRQNYENIAHTTVQTTANHGDVTITLASSADFNPAGSIWVSANDDDGQISVIQYTANNQDTGVLSGVIGIPAGGLNAGNDVWYQTNFGMPRNYTIDNSSGTPTIFFDMPFSDQYAGNNIYMDYYSIMLPVTDETTLLDEPEYDMFVSYLKWKIKYLKSNGMMQASGTEQVSGTIIQSQDQDYQEWITRKNALIQKELSGQRLRFYPGYNN